MPDTANLTLPLVAPSQAQKHVTVNEALTRIDALTQLVLASLTETMPPALADEGAVYFVPAGAVNAWSGEAGRLAIAQGGGWTFIDPAIGWRAYVRDEGYLALWNGTSWEPLGLGTSASGAGMTLRTVETDHALSAGGTSATAAFLPAGCLVFAITGRVINAITGGAVSFELGVAGSTDRYGSGIGVAAGSFLRGLTSSPQAYYADTPLLLTAQGGSFTGGVVRFAAHIAEFSLPQAS